MPAHLVPLLCSLVVSAGLAPTYQASVRTEARVEQDRPPAGENTTSEVLEVQPSIAVAGSSKGLRLELAYAPRFTHQGGDGPDRNAWLQLAWAEVHWRPSATWQLQAKGTATAGTIDLFRVSTTPSQPGEPPPVGPATPAAVSLDYRAYQLALAVEGRLGRTLGLGAGLDAMREGGASAAERGLLPLRQTALARGTLSWRLTGRTSLAGTVTGSVTRYFDVAVASAGAGEPERRSWSNWLGRAEAAWRHGLSPRARIWAGGGLTWVSSGAPGAASAGLQPNGEVGLGGESGPGWPRLSGTVTAVGDAVEERLTGTVARRVGLNAWGSLAPAERWTLSASALGSRVMSGSTEGETFTAGELSLGWSAWKAFSLKLGGRWTTQWPASAGPPTSRWTAFLSVQAGYESRRPGLPGTSAGGSPGP